MNVVILKRKSEGPSWSLGIEDEEFSQRKPDKGLITKKEIRVLSLHALKLKEKQHSLGCWDVYGINGN